MKNKIYVIPAGLFTGVGTLRGKRYNGIYILMESHLAFDGATVADVTLSPPTSEAGVQSPHGLKWESW